MKEKKSVIIIVIAIFAVLLLCCGIVVGASILGISPFGFRAGQGVNEPVNDYDYTEEADDGAETAMEEEDLQEEAGEPDGDVAEPAVTTGTITGSVSYPSEFIPEGMTICAEPDTDTDSYCTTKLIEQTAALPKYELEVPAGNYYVYAYDANGDPDYTAYYSEFVTCGLSVECPSHDPILITVVAGETIDDIDPGDWYNF